MFQTTSEKVYMCIDRLEEDEVLKVSKIGGYRLSGHIFEKYRTDVKTLKEDLRVEYADFTGQEVKSPRRNNRDNIEYRLVKDPRKQGEEGKFSSMRPKLTGNLVVDIVILIGYNLSGDKWYIDEKGEWRHLKSWMSIGEIIEELKNGWVFID